MFDLLMRDTAGQGVPVPLPGRGLLYLGVDGGLYCKGSDGVVLPLTVGAPGAPGAPGNDGALSLLTTGAAIVAPWSTAVATVLDIPWSQVWAGGVVRFDAGGTFTKNATAQNLVATIVAGGATLATLTIALTTTINTNAPWQITGVIRVGAGLAVVQLVGDIKGVFTIATDGADISASMIAGRETLSLRVATSGTTATLKSAGARAYKGA